MFLSMNWISDFVDLSGLDKMDLIHRFSLSTAEVENEIFEKGKDLSGVVVAEIKSVEPHPESKKLHLLKVDAGDGKLTDVVCGAPNVRVGMKTAFAKVGAQIGDITIAPRPLAGYESYGMCCSEKEIGISDDNSGIMDITDDIPCGTDIKDAYAVDDIVFEVDNKSLTNRPDLWGHYGIAREFSADRLNRLLPESCFDPYRNPPVLLHGFAGERIAAAEFSVNDLEVLEAIRYHTLGFPGMGKTAQIVFVADYISRDRNFVGEAFRRRIVSLPSEEAVLAVIEGTADYFTKTGRPLHPDTEKEAAFLRRKRK